MDGQKAAYTVQKKDGYGCEKDSSCSNYYMCISDECSDGGICRTRRAIRPIGGSDGRRFRACFV